MVVNGFDLDRPKLLKERFIHGLKDRLVAYDMALEAIHGVLGHDGERQAGAVSGDSGT